MSSNILFYYLKLWNSSRNIIGADINDVNYLGIFNSRTCPLYRSETQN